jgi:CRISPR-associated protein Csb2
MIVIEAKFPTTYHATPWNRQVKEGAVEFPPSPARILRALLSSYYSNSTKYNETEIGDLLCRLGNTLPTYFVPRSVYGANRQLVPVLPPKEFVRSNRPYCQETQDAFLKIVDPLFIYWDLEFSELEVEIIKSLLADICYMGRTESTCLMNVVSDYPSKPNCYPQTNGKQSLMTFTQLTPENAIELVGVDTRTIKASRSNGAKNTQWVNYSQPKYSKVNISTLKVISNINFVRFSINPKDPVPATNSYKIANYIHQRLASYTRHPTLIGCDDDGMRVGQGDGHLFILPETNRFGTIEFISCYAPEGFDIEAIMDLAKLPVKAPQLNMLLVQNGAAPDYERVLPWWGKSTIWQTATPLFLPRSITRKRNGTFVNSVSDQIELMLGWRGINTAFKVKAFANPRSHWQSLKTCAETPQSDIGLGVQIEFEIPIEGFLSLGKFSHFGFGQFLPVVSSQEFDDRAKGW